MTTLCTRLPDQLRLLLVDDHQIFLDGLALALSSLSHDLQIDTAARASEAEQRLRQHNYDLILLDLRLPDESGLDLLQRWQQHGETTPVAILSANDSPLQAQVAMAAGALGFISKTADGAALRHAVRSLLLGETLPLPSHPSPLTPRQLEILQLLAEGLPNKAISRQLNLAEDTVKTHLKALFEICEVHTRTACVSTARQRGWL